MVERDSKKVRELRLEGAALFLIVALLGAGLIGTFFLGRWYERSSSPLAGIERPASDPLENVVPAGEIEDVDAGAGSFDKIAGSTAAEPSREVAPPAQKTEPPPERPPEPRTQPAQRSQPGSGSGSFFVQIAAFRDRDGADQLSQELTAGGYPVRVFSEDGAAGRLYKVRVGGYGTREEALTIAAELNTKGHEGAFPTKVD